MGINTCYVEDVPVFWTESRGALEAQLVIRTGIADEQLHERGLAELTLGVLLEAVGGRAGGLEGHVDLLTTTISCSGSHALAELLHRLGPALASADGLWFAVGDDLARADRTRRPTVEERLLRTRFGHRGVGIAGAPWFGARRIEPAQVRDRASSHVNAGNVVLVCTGPPPPTLGLELPGGLRVPAVEPRPVLAHRAVTVDPDGRCALALVGPTDLAFVAAVQVVRESTRARLVEGKRLCAEVAGGFSRLGPRTVQAVLAPAGVRGAWQDVVDEMVAELDRSVLHGLPDDAVRRAFHTIGDRISNEGSLPSLAREAATDWLLGAPPRRPGELAAELRRLTSERVVAALAQAVSSAMWLVPPGVAVDLRHRPPETGDHGDLPGERYEQTHRQPGEPPVHLTLGPAGVTVTVDGVGRRSLRWKDCLAAAVGLGGEWRFFGADGSEIVVSESRFRGSVPVGAAVRSWLPAHLVVPADEASAVDRVG